MASAEDVGKKLLGEVEEVGLDEVGTWTRAMSFDI